MHTTGSQTSGFTLIEVLIVTAIIGILAAIAYPSYQNSVIKSWRANATACLSEIAQRMERRYTASFSYTGALPAVGCSSEGEMPDRYAFAFATDEPTGTTFIIQATPQGAQARDSCGTLTLDQTGQMGADDSIDLCWRR